MSVCVCVYLWWWKWSCQCVAVTCALWIPMFNCCIALNPGLHLAIPVSVDQEIERESLRGRCLYVHGFCFSWRNSVRLHPHVKIWPFLGFFINFMCKHLMWPSIVCVYIFHALCKHYQHMLSTCAADQDGQTSMRACWSQWLLNLHEILLWSNCVLSTSLACCWWCWLCTNYEIMLMFPTASASESLH